MGQSLSKKVVVIGGGTGSYTLLRGLKRYADRVDITSIVTMADSGGSTGRLRDEFGQLPVGDVRMALSALAADVDSHAQLLRTLFLYRFDKGEGLSGHTFGNLLLTALTDILGSPVAAIETASILLRVAGTVIPITTDNVHLTALYDDGLLVTGEHQIDESPAERHKHRITTLALSPPATINPAAAQALREADMIILGPGDFYTSILANCVVDGFRAVFMHTQAQVVYVANLMSRSGQTHGMTVSDYVAEIIRYTGVKPDYTIVNETAVAPEVISRYATDGTHPVLWELADQENYNFYVADVLSDQATVPISGDALTRSLIRHDSDKLANVMMQLLFPQ